MGFLCFSLLLQKWVGSGAIPNTPLALPCLRGTRASEALGRRKPAKGQGLAEEPQPYQHLNPIAFVWKLEPNRVKKDKLRLQCI